MTIKISVMVLLLVMASDRSCVTDATSECDEPLFIDQHKSGSIHVEAKVLGLLSSENSYSRNTALLSSG